MVGFPEARRLRRAHCSYPRGSTLRLASAVRESASPLSTLRPVQALPPTRVRRRARGVASSASSLCRRMAHPLPHLTKGRASMRAARLAGDPRLVVPRAHRQGASTRPIRATSAATTPRSPFAGGDGGQRAAHARRADVSTRPQTGDFAEIQALARLISDLPRDQPASSPLRSPYHAKASPSRRAPCDDAGPRAVGRAGGQDAFHDV